MEPSIKLDFETIEKRLGGPVAAAGAAGVSLVTWWRWRTGRTEINPRIKATLRLLAEHAITKEQDGRRKA